MKQIIILQKQNISLNPKKKSPEHSAWKGLQSNTVAKNPIFHNLN